MPDTRPKSAPPKARQAKPKGRHVEALAIPGQEPGRPLNQAEVQAFAALIATGCTQTKAAMTIRPWLAPISAEGVSCIWARQHAEAIMAARKAAADQAAQAHGISASWYLGALKSLFETPLAAITPEHIACKEYSAIMTDSGPKTTVKKDSPLAILTQIGKAAGLDRAGLTEAPPPAVDADAQAERVIGSVIARIIQPGSPINRAVQAGRQA